MGSHEDDDELFRLDVAAPEVAPDRVTTIRQGVAGIVALLAAAGAAWLLPKILGGGPSAPPGLISIGVTVLVPLTLALTGLVLVVAVATSLVQARAATRT